MANYVCSLDILYPVKTHVHTQEIVFHGKLHRLKYGKSSYDRHSIEYSGFITAKHPLFTLYMKYFGGRSDWFIYKADMYMTDGNITYCIDGVSSVDGLEKRYAYPEVNEIPNWYHDHFEDKELIELFKPYPNQSKKEFEQPIDCTFSMWFNFDNFCKYIENLKRKNEEEKSCLGLITDRINMWKYFH